MQNKIVYRCEKKNIELETESEGEGEGEGEKEAEKKLWKSKSIKEALSQRVPMHSMNLLNSMHSYELKIINMNVLNSYEFIWTRNNS